MLAISRFAASDQDFQNRAQPALAALRVCQGFTGGRLARAIDGDQGQDLWCLMTEWDSVGSYRRALGQFPVRQALMSLGAEAINEPSAYESLVEADSTALRFAQTDREDTR